MRIGVVPFGSALYGRTLTFRGDLLRRPLGLVMSPEDLAGEDRQIHIAAERDGVVLGTVVLKPVSSDLLKLRQMATTPEMRGQGLGRALIGFAETIAAERGFTAIEMSARVSARGFYETLGYGATGAEFVEVGVPHIRMAKTLASHR